MSNTKILTLHGDQTVESLALFVRCADAVRWAEIRVHAVDGDFEVWGRTADPAPAVEPQPLELVPDPPPAASDVDREMCECGAGPFQAGAGLAVHRKSAPHLRWARQQAAQRAVATLEAPPANPVDDDDDLDEAPAATQRTPADPDDTNGEHVCECGRRFSRPNGLNRHRNYAHPPGKGTNSGPIRTVGPRVGETHDDWQRRLRQAAAAAL